MPRSEPKEPPLSRGRAPGAIALRLLLATLGSKRLPPAERLALARAALASGGSSARSEPSSLSPSSDRWRVWERSKAVSETLRTVASSWASNKAELEDDRGRAGSATPGVGGRAGRALAQAA
jgi:hypothetical protein